MTDDLTDALAARYDEPPLGSPEAEQWRITDDSQATWAARRLRDYEGERDRLVERAEEERAAIDAWLHDATAGARGKIDWFREHLEGYYRKLVADGGPSVPKTYRVPGAKLKRSKTPDRLEVRTENDEYAFIRWCLENDRTEYLRITVDKKAVKDSVNIGYLVLDPPIVYEKGRTVSPVEYGTEHGVYLGHDEDADERLPGIVWVVGDEQYGVEVER